LILTKRNFVAFISAGLLALLVAGLFFWRGSSVRAASDAAQPSDADRQNQLKQAYGRLPMSFEANQGQADAAVKYISRGHGYQVFLTEDEAVLVLQSQKRDRKGADDEQGVGSHQLPEINSSALRFKLPKSGTDGVGAASAINATGLLPG